MCLIINNVAGLFLSRTIGDLTVSGKEEMCESLPVVLRRPSSATYGLMKFQPSLLIAVGDVSAFHCEIIVSCDCLRAPPAATFQDV